MIKYDIHNTYCPLHVFDRIFYFKLTTATFLSVVYRMIPEIIMLYFFSWFHDIDNAGHGKWHLLLLLFFTWLRWTPTKTDFSSRGCITRDEQCNASRLKASFAAIVTIVSMEISNFVEVTALMLWNSETVFFGNMLWPAIMHFMAFCPMSEISVT